MGNMPDEEAIRQAEYWIDRAETFWRESEKTEDAAITTMGYIERALTLDPLNYKAWSDKGFILKQLGNLDTAIMCFDRALALNNEIITPWYNKGVLLGLMGKFEEAVKCYEQVLKQNPEHTMALRDYNVLIKIIKNRK